VRQFGHFTLNFSCERRNMSRRGTGRLPSGKPSVREYWA
jgi:hypothetical protein